MSKKVPERKENLIFKKILLIIATEFLYIDLLNWKLLKKLKSCHPFKKGASQKGC